MEFQRVVESRRMVRAFEETAVDPAVIERILSNAARAPSAGNAQGWTFLLLTEPADRDLFWRVAWPEADRAGSRRTDVMKAPVLVIPCADKDAYLDRYAEPDKGQTDRDQQRWPVPFWLVDTAFASMLMLLTAVDEGLGALFFRLHHAAEIARVFGIPDTVDPIGVIAFGRQPSSLEPSSLEPSSRDVPSSSMTRGRKPQHELVHRGRW